MLSSSPPTRSPSRRIKPTPTRLALTPKSSPSSSMMLSIPTISFSDFDDAGSGVDTDIDDALAAEASKSRITRHGSGNSSGKSLNGVGNDGVLYKEEDLEHLSELGSGSSGTVSKVLHRPTGKVLARKQISLLLPSDLATPRTTRRLLRELKILRKCHSPYILSFTSYFLSPSPSSPSELSLLTELLPLGSLERIYKSLGPINEDIIAKIVVCVLRGLQYLESVKVVHRDIKPSNILVGANGEIKIGDFGVSKEVMEGGTGAATFTGTQGYLAPERLHSADATTTSDIWSLGVTAMELALARFPFPPPEHPPLTSPLDLMMYIEKEESPRLPGGGGWSKPFEEFVEGCLVKDGTARWGVGECMASSFCKRAIESGMDLTAWVEDVKTVLPIL